MKPSPRSGFRAGWLELPVVTGILLATTLLVMWGQRPADGCTLRPEVKRRLVLSRQVDREHLDADRATIDRVARRYASASTDPVMQQTRFVECETGLVEQLSQAHGLAVDAIRAGGEAVQ
jgi:hypothetical protein